MYVSRLCYPAQLQELNIIQYLEETSHLFLDHMVNIINSCINLNKIKFKNITDVQSFSVDFSHLTHLRHLDLSGCTNLIKLPNSFSKLLRLQYLSLRDCKNLSIPRYILGEISTLMYVDFSGSCYSCPGEWHIKIP
jgi:Leucine-rich repeat (LRR) protein